MRESLKHGSHLVLLALVFLAVLGVFLIVRAAVVPAGFGQYGHYRAPSIDDVRAHKISYAGQTVCAGCHDDAVTARAQGKHKGVACEACHGPQAAHAEDPSSIKPKLPDTSTLCRRCHEADPAKPKGFPQVASREHSGGEACKTCHKPHSPKI